MKELYRVVDFENSADDVALILNANFRAGYKMAMQIGMKVVMYYDPKNADDEMPDGWQVPGAAGTAGNA